MLILDLVKVLTKFKIPYALVGGYAVSLHGATRGTLDVDLIIPLEEKYYIAIEKALNSMKLIPRLPVSAKEIFSFREEYIESRNLVAWSFYDPDQPFHIVDIIITEDLNKVKTTKVNIKNIKVSLIAVEDLIKMKTKSARPQDLEDVKALRKLKK